jgi:hypothetical protein
MTGQAVRRIAESGRVVAKTPHVVEDVVQVARQEGLDWRTLREAAALAGRAAVKLIQWWLCGRGLHAWTTFEDEDGAPFEECSVCDRQRPLPGTSPQSVGSGDGTS